MTQGAPSRSILRSLAVRLGLAYPPGQEALPGGSRTARPGRVPPHVHQEIDDLRRRVEALESLVGNQNTDPR
ncbi:hypothetical protein ABH926_004211 [Catenulispora sp. GP43]|uniref:hypothetical protein n=1 Tax=Catenulispora sp. GP43 TaxID=3156263 RepID=UPI003518BFC1